jgi:uncharacterized protein (DUF433 family)
MSFTASRRRVDLEPGGEPTMSGALRTVGRAVELQSYGMPEEQILATYPTLSRADLRAASAYPAEFWGICLGEPGEDEEEFLAVG